jgi:hypothetical protein
MKLTRREVVFLLVTACESALPAAWAHAKPPIKVNTDPALQRATYHTYKFVDEPGTNRSGYSTPITRYFGDTIRPEMDTRGFPYAASTPDLLVSFNANARESVDAAKKEELWEGRRRTAADGTVTL